MAALITARTGLLRLEASFYEDLSENDLRLVHSSLAQNSRLQRLRLVWHCECNPEKGDVPPRERFEKKLRCSSDGAPDARLDFYVRF